MNNLSVEAPSPANKSLDRQPNLILGLLGGTIAMLICAALRGSTLNSFQSHASWVAIVLGLAVGLGARWLGRGSSLPLGLIAAGLTVVGCFLGDLIASSVYLSRLFGWSFSEMMWRVINMPGYFLGHIVSQFKANFVPLDLLFYAVGIYLAFQIAFGQPRKAVQQAA
jgi:hypothetical protein